MGANAIIYALSLPLGTAIQLAIVLSYYFRHRPIKWSFDRGIVRALLIGGMPLFLWTFLQSAYGQIDATVLSLFADKNVVGWFAAAAQITNMLIMVPAAVTAVALPVLCELYVRPGNSFDRAATRATVSTLLIMAPIGAGLAVSSTDVFRLLHYPEVFQNAALTMSLLALALPVTGVMMVLATLAVAIGQEKEWLKISAFAVCVFPPLYVVLIWLTQTNFGNGSIGAGLANLIGESSLLVWGWIVLPRRVRQPEVVRPSVQIIALCAAMVLLVVGLQWIGLPILLYVPAGALFYATGTWILKLITPDDIDLVKSAVRRRSKRPTPTAAPEVPTRPVEA
jgi:O-antigen/teichoic acid export membrane protein